MIDREKLIELMLNCPQLDVLYGEEWSTAADFLLSHGVTFEKQGSGSLIYYHTIKSRIRMKPTDMFSSVLYAVGQQLTI